MDSLSPASLLFGRIDRRTEQLGNPTIFREKEKRAMERADGRRDLKLSSTDERDHLCVDGTDSPPKCHVSFSFSFFFVQDEYVYSSLPGALRAVCQ